MVLPQKNEKKKPINTAPSFMSQVSDATGNMASENPNTMPTAYGEMGPLSRLILPASHAITSPWGNIYYNKKLIEEDKVPVSEVVRHEMTHVGQGPMAVFKSMFSSKTRDEYEKEAQEAEVKPRRRKNDIFLPTPVSSKGIDVSPSKKR